MDRREPAAEATGVRVAVDAEGGDAFEEEVWEAVRAACTKQCCADT